MYSTTAAASTLLCLALTATAQTPVGTSPSTQSRLGVQFGNTTVTPNIELPNGYVLSAPSLTDSAASSSATYIIAMIDLSIRQTQVGFAGPYAAGISSDRTTRLHWFQEGLTLSPNGSLTSTTSAGAPFAAPMPPQGDIPHTYTLYLLTQPSDFKTPPALTNGTYTSPATSARYNFSLDAVTSQNGVNLVAGNYFRVENVNNTAAPSVPTNATSSNTTVGTASSTSTPVAFTGAAAKAVVPVLGLAGVAAALFL